MSKMPDFGRYCTPDKYNYFKSFREQFRENGAIHIPSALGADEIALVEQAYNHKLNSSGGGLRQFYENSDTLFLQSVGGHEATPALIE